MTRLDIGARVQILASLPGFHLKQGRITAVAEPFTVDERSRLEALRELRLYDVQLDDGRRFRFRGKELQQSARLTGIAK